MDDFIARAKERWKWTLTIMQPDIILSDMVADAISQVRVKKNPPSLAGLRFETFGEGRSAQILHQGPFDREGPTIQSMHRFIELSGGRSSGKHHEISLNDFRRTVPARLKTVLRQPFTL